MCSSACCNERLHNRCKHHLQIPKGALCLRFFDTNGRTETLFDIYHLCKREGIHTVWLNFGYRFLDDQKQCRHLHPILLLVVDILQAQNRVLLFFSLTDLFCNAPGKVFVDFLWCQSLLLTHFLPVFGTRITRK